MAKTNKKQATLTLPNMITSNVQLHASKKKYIYI